MDPSKNAGWNDPPLFSYTESLQHAKSPKRNPLNKRIAYPMNATTVSKLLTADPITIPSVNPGLLPPPVGISLMNNIDFESKMKDNDVEYETTRFEELSSEDMLAEITNNINIFMSTKEEILKTQHKEEQIRRRLHIMENLWEHKLTLDIKHKVLELSKALKDEDTKLANEIQVNLMVDYPKLCSEFIPAFRQLINVR